MTEYDSQLLERATWTKVEESIRTGRVTKVILPIGSLEQHGPHLPLSTDTVLADYVAGEVCRLCKDTFVVPAIHLGCADEHIGFPGTISIRSETMSNLILDVSHSVFKSGLRKIFIINGHGGNRNVIDATLRKIKRELPEMQLYAFTVLDVAKERFDRIRESGRRLVGHADELETSMMLAIQPECVDMSKALREEPSLPKPLSFESKDMARISFAWNAVELTKSGIVGDASLAKIETGKDLLDFVADVISKAINEL